MNSLTRPHALLLTALLGGLGVILGAFGAHALESHLVANGHLDEWKTATLYHLVHAAVLLGMCAMPRFPEVPWLLMFAGTLLFGGALYALSLTDQKWLGAVAPLGGMLMIAGWLSLAWVARGLCSGEGSE